MSKANVSFSQKITLPVGPAVCLGASHLLQEGSFKFTAKAKYSAHLVAIVAALSLFRKRSLLADKNSVLTIQSIGQAAFTWPARSLFRCEEQLSLRALRKIILKPLHKVVRIMLVIKLDLNAIGEPAGRQLLSHIFCLIKRRIHPL